MAQVFGTVALFGLSTETGIITEFVSFAYKQDSKELRGATGDVTGKSYYNESADISISGYLPTTSAFATTLASTITLINTVTDFYKGTGGGSTIVESITKSLSNQDYQKIEVSATNYPFVS